jgi:signal transduction histidine kinase
MTTPRRQRRPARLASFLVGTCVAAMTLSIVFTLANPGRTSVPQTLAADLSYLSFPIVGWLIASRRPGNAIGWCFIGVGLAGIIGELALEYAWYSTAVHGGTLPLDALLLALSSSWWAVALTLIGVYSLLLFPDGHLPSPRWRVVAWTATIGVALVMIASPFSPDIDTFFPGAPESPLELSPMVSIAGGMTLLGVLLFIPMVLASVVGLIQRFRRSRGEEREQMRWFVFGAAVFGVGLVIGLVLDSLGHEDARANVLGISIMAIPISAGIGILRSGLWDLDVVIKKTAVAVVLATLLALVGSLVLALFGQVAIYQDADPRISVITGIVLGLLFVPLLRLSKRLATRIIFGRRATPYEVLTEFSHRVGETYETDDVSARMARLLVRATGATSAQVVLRVGTDDRVAATQGEVNGERHVVPVTHHGDRLGELVVTMPPNDPLDHTKERLIADLAAQAGPVFQNMRLIEDLKASRQRLVSAQDEERRKLERNLHDGAQQQLVALSVQLKLARTLLDRDPTRTGELLDSLQSSAGQAIEDLRDLARGIYPPLLADKGLTTAIDSQARKAAIPVAVEADDVGRYPQDVEAAVYFCVLEALNNVAKYAGASLARVRLSDGTGELTFQVIDDGRGFDPSATGYGTGLQGIADRLAALGGELDVSALPGQGATITGRIPIRGPEETTA